MQRMRIFLTVRTLSLYHSAIRYGIDGVTFLREIQRCIGSRGFIIRILHIPVVAVIILVVKADHRTTAVTIKQIQIRGGTGHQLRCTCVTAGRGLNHVQEHIVIGKNEQFKNQTVRFNSVVVNGIAFEADLDEGGAVTEGSRLSADVGGAAISAEYLNMLRIATEADVVVTGYIDGRARLVIELETAQACDGVIAVIVVGRVHCCHTGGGI